MLGLQAEKIKAIDRAMQDDGQVCDPLTIEELAGLFGFVYEENGVTQVRPDYEEEARNEEAGGDDHHDADGDAEGNVEVEVMDLD